MTRYLDGSTCRKCHLSGRIYSFPSYNKSNSHLFNLIKILKINKLLNLLDWLIWQGQTQYMLIYYKNSSLVSRIIFNTQKLLYCIIIFISIFTYIARSTIIFEKSQLFIYVIIYYLFLKCIYVFNVGYAWHRLICTQFSA